MGTRNLKDLAWKNTLGFCSSGTVCWDIAPWLSEGPKSGDQSGRFATTALFQVGKGPRTDPELGRLCLWSLWPQGPELSYGYFCSRANLQSVPIAVLMVQGAAHITNQLSITCQWFSSEGSTSLMEDVWGCLWLSKWLNRSTTRMLMSCNAPDRSVQWKLPCWKS